MNINKDDMSNISLQNGVKYNNQIPIKQKIIDNDFDGDDNDYGCDDDNTLIANGNYKESTGRWTREEHLLFIKGLELYGKGWKKIAGLIKTRTVVQIRTHAQKYFLKLAKARQSGESSGSLTMDGKPLNHRKKKKKRRLFKNIAIAPPLQPYIKLPVSIDNENGESTIDVDDSLYNFLSPQLPTYSLGAVTTQSVDGMNTTTIAYLNSSVDNNSFMIYGSTPNVMNSIDSSTGMPITSTQLVTSISTTDTALLTNHMNSHLASHLSNANLYNLSNNEQESAVMSVDCSTGKLDVNDNYDHEEDMPFSCILESLNDDEHTDPNQVHDILADDDTPEQSNSQVTGKDGNHSEDALTDKESEGEGIEHNKQDNSNHSTSNDDIHNSNNNNSNISDSDMSRIDQIDIKNNDSYNKSTYDSNTNNQLSTITNNPISLHRSTTLTAIPNYTTMDNSITSLPLVSTVGVKRSLSVGDMPLTIHSDNNLSDSLARINNPSSECLPVSLYSDVPEWYQKGHKVDVLLKEAESVDWLQDTGYPVNNNNYMLPNGMSSQSLSSLNVHSISISNNNNLLPSTIQQNQIKLKNNQKSKLFNSHVYIKEEPMHFDDFDTMIRDYSLNNTSNLNNHIDNHYWNDNDEVVDMDIDLLTSHSPNKRSIKSSHSIDNFLLLNHSDDLDYHLIDDEQDDVMIDQLIQTNSQPKSNKPSNRSKKNKYTSN